MHHNVRHNAPLLSGRFVSRFLRGILTAAAALFLPIASLAQRPTHVPGNDEPLRVFESVESVIFYIVLPLAIVVLYVIWRRRLRREQAAREGEAETPEGKGKTTEGEAGK